ncbi:Heat shock protein 17 [Heracleum sosnowskyi]|uniref:Heat shock protein 17 n=1 Tax=Heracleum sosnowskyi TaxID=360622 RepID=A0AAD8HHQ0_9APIA|nr:Heat shock protein 17 [Heracleum sosnowskyi]
MYQEKLAGMFTEVMRQISSSLCFSDKETSGIASVKWFIVVVIVFATIDENRHRKSQRSSLAETWEVIQISGERNRKQEEKGDTWHRVERSSGKLMRRFRASRECKGGPGEGCDGEWSLENGVLTVTVPKEDVKKPDVKSNSDLWLILFLSND